jgi:hypothetical protein
VYAISLSFSFVFSFTIKTVKIANNIHRTIIPNII